MSRPSAVHPQRRGLRPREPSLLVSASFAVYQASLVSLSKSLTIVRPGLIGALSYSAAARGALPSGAPPPPLPAASLVDSNTPGKQRFVPSLTRLSSPML